MLNTKNNIPLVSVIITCKNRLAHLKETLPKICVQNLLEIIVVDYGCTEGTEDWVKTHFPMVTVVHVNDDPIFSLSRARNMGARHAKGKWLMFADADIIINLTLHEWMIKNAKQNEFYSVNPKNEPSLCGTVVVNKEDFHTAGEYDEVFRGWGGEDLELYQRLKKFSITHKYINDRYFSAIRHGDAIRQLSIKEGGIGNKKQALIAARLYTKVIGELFIDDKILAFNDRKQIMDTIKNSLAKAPEISEKSALKLTIKKPSLFLKKPLFDYNII